MGDEAFFSQILRTYYDRYKGGNAGTQDFIAVAEEVSGQESSPFFSEWLYSTPDRPCREGDRGMWELSFRRARLAPPGTRLAR